MRAAQHYPARSAGTRRPPALNRSALRAAQVTPVRCAAARSKTSKTEKHGALRHT
ncbi:hypothetical protein A2U01_0074983, partial [Trifolium medium]|nr:hypothetical protein [Trifolium medium]